MARGSVKKYTAKDGTVSYRVRVDLGIDPATGRRRQGQCTRKTRRAADEKLRVWLAEVETGTAQPRDTQTMAHLLTSWLAARIAVGHKTTTYDRYEASVRVHLIPAFGAIPVQKLTVGHVETFYADKLRAGASDHLIRHCKTRLAQALDMAVSQGTVPRNVCRLAALPARRPQPPPTKERSWTPDQAKAFLAVAKDDSRYGPLWTLMLQTGLRIAEAVGLRWRDLDLDGRRLTVTQQVLRPRKGGGPSPLDVPKTPRAHRTVKIPPSLVTALRSHKAAQAQQRLQAGDTWLDNDLVFCRADGRPVPSYLPRYDLDVLVARAGVPRLTSHGLRRTCITLALRRGVPLATVSRLAGHSSISITQDVYQDVTRDLLDEGADLMADLFAEEKNTPQRGHS